MTDTVKTLDLDAVQTFALVAAMQNFTRAAEATGTTQSAVSLKLKRLEKFLGRHLVERTPRSVQLTEDGAAFLGHAKALLEANERALSAKPDSARRLRLGISDHASGPELPHMLARSHAADPALAFDVTLGFSRQILDAFDLGRFDAVIVRKEAGRRGGEILCDDEFGWFAGLGFEWRSSQPLPIASLAPPCGVRAMAIRALDAAQIRWTEAFVGGGLSAVTAAVEARLAVAPLARRVAPPGALDVTAKYKLPQLARSKVALHSRISDPRGKAALRVLASAFRTMSATAG